MLKRMMIPLDGSENSESMVDYALRFAEPAGSSITLLTVVDPDEVIRSKDGPGPDRTPVGVPAQDRPAGLDNSSGDATFPKTRMDGIDYHSYDAGSGYGTQVIESVAEKANAYVNQVAKRVSESEVPVRALVTIGSPEDEILRVAKNEAADLVAMATQSNSLIARGVLGSVTDRIVRTAEIPVLVISPKVEETARPDTVIAPLDGSAVSETAIPVASEIAKQLDAELVFVRVSNHIEMSPFGDFPSPLPDDLADRFIEPYLRPIVARAKKSGITASMRTPRGRTVRCLSDVADEYDNSIVVMGTRGQSGVKRLMLGSVTDKVIRTSGQPVVVVPPEMNWAGSVL